jgi:hypothetical protein
MTINAGAALAGMRRRDRRICQQCVGRFIGIVTAKYCSNACRQKAKRNKAREAALLAAGKRYARRRG